MSYVYIEFPKWKFHRTEKARIVKTREEEAALGTGWANTPAAFFDDVVKEPVVVDDEPAQESELTEAELQAMTVAQLRSLASDKGITNASRMNKTTLIEALLAL